VPVPLWSAFQALRMLPGYHMLLHAFTGAHAPVAPCPACLVPAGGILVELPLAALLSDWPTHLTH
jgi:hypothetical protein